MLLAPLCGHAAHAQEVLPSGIDKAALDHEIAFYRHKADVAPSDGLDLSFLAGAYVKKARMTGEMKWYSLAEETARKSLINLPFANINAKLVLANVAQARHLFDTARVIIDDVLAEHPSDEGARSLSIIIHLGKGEPVAASADADRLLSQPPPSSGAFTFHALAMEAQGRTAEAGFDFKRAVEKLEPTEAAASAWTRALYGRYLFRNGRYAEAREMYTKSLQALTGYPLALGLLAELELEEGDYVHAEEYAINAFKRSNSPAYLTLVARIKSHEGDATEAEKYFRESEGLLRAALATDSFGHRIDLAKLLIERGRIGDRAEAVALAREDASRRSDLNTLLTLAKALFGAEMASDARSVAQQALRTGARNAELYHLAGLIEQKLDITKTDPRTARMYWEEALEVNPKYEPSRRMLAASDKNLFHRMARSIGERAWIIAAALALSLLLALYGMVKKTRSTNQ